jgi:hypothetical protein
VAEDPQDTAVLDSLPDDATPPRDPETGRFVKTEALPSDASPGNGAAPAAPAPAKPKHPSYLYEQAADLLSFTKEDCDEYTSAQLDRAVRAAWKRAQATYEQYRREQAVQQAPPTPAPPKPAEDDYDLGDYLTSQEFFDPRFSGELKRHFASQAKQIKAVQAQLAEYQQREAQREVRTLGEAIDLAFDSLGDSYKATFGEGSIDDLDPKSAEADRRRAVVASLGVDPRTLSPGRLRRLVVQKATALFQPAAPVAPAKNDLGGYDVAKKNGHPTKDEWQRGGVAIPTDRGGSPEPDGEVKARANLERRLRDMGVGTEGGAEDAKIMDGIPD